MKHEQTQKDLDRFHCLNRLFDTMVKLGMLTHLEAPFPGTKQHFIVRYGDKFDKSQTDSKKQYENNSADQYKAGQ